ncbi:MAG: hypothetical protein VX583_03890 [Bdellovibrionota bacterium]
MIFILVLLVRISNAHQETIRVGFIESPPLIYNKDEKLVGALVDYLNDILPNFNIKFVKTPLSRVPDLLDKDVIQIFPMYFYSAERADKVHYIPTSFHALNPCLCALKEYKIPSTIRDPKSFEQKTIVHLRGTLKNRDFLNFKNTNYLELPTQDYYEKSLKMLKLKRAEYAYFADFYQVKRFLNNKKYSNIHCENSHYPKDEMFFVTNKNFYLKKNLELKISKTSFKTYLKKHLSRVNWQVD